MPSPLPAHTREQGVHAPWTVSAWAQAREGTTDACFLVTRPALAVIRPAEVDAAIRALAAQGLDVAQAVSVPPVHARHKPTATKSSGRD